MRTRAIIVASIAALVVPAAALAYRPATLAEQKGMIYNPSGRYYFGARVAVPRSVPLRCFVTDISTVVRGSRWGGVAFSRYAAHHERRCRTANGDTIEHKMNGRWYVLWEGSEGYPPRHDTRHLKGVPRAIAKDLVAGLSARSS